ncbi:hypothetical protein ES708_18020 [subsurface metagenome]
MYLLTFTGAHQDYQTAFHGFNAYLIVGCYNMYSSTMEVNFIKLGEESYTDNVVVSKSGNNIRLQSDNAGGDEFLYWTLLRLH